jgi:hypothetical protein
VNSGQWSVVSEQWTVVSGQKIADWGFVVSHPIRKKRGMDGAPSFIGGLRMRYPPRKTDETITILIVI